MDKLAELFSALGSETRIRLLQELAQRPLCVGMLAMRLGITQSAVSQHLTVLRNAGLVESDKRGSYVHYSLTEDAPERCRAALAQVLSTRDQQESGQ
jgi:ArsR family transcriptional regulator, arsenate/arsenite/antimonite-responsive transcriptional repressor